MNFIVGYHTDVGIRKSVNQDAMLIKIAKSPYGRIGLFVVCDGMGGLSSGEVASSTAVKDINSWFDEQLPKIDFDLADSEYIYNELSCLIFSINKKILSFGRRENKILGTTLTLLLSIDERYYIMQVGDSRIYKVRNIVEQLTKDQTYVQREVDRGNLTKEEAEKHPRRNVLLQCIGAREELEPVMSTGNFEDGEVYVICSDGFYKKLRKEELLNDFNALKINSEEQITSKAKEIIERVKERSEKDNISAIIFKVIA